MNFILKKLRPAPYIDEIQNPEVVKEKYHYWRIRTLYSMFIGYALYYFTRKSFIFAMPGLLEDLHFEKSELGLLASILAITYGISKFASGILSDRSNPRFFMAYGLMLTGLFNIFFGMSSSLVMFALFWGLNGWFQGWGWPPCARFLTHWYSHSERGSWWAIWNVSHNLGAFIIPWIVGACLSYLGWRYAMYVPGVICIFGGFFLINRLRDTPQSIGLPPIEKFRNDYGKSTKDEIEKENELTTNQILLDYVIKNPYIWLLAFAYLFVYVAREGINNWTALFLIETKEYSRIGANGCVSLFEVGGLFGSLFAGWASDYIFGARRGPVNTLFACGMLISILLFWFIPQGYPFLDYSIIFVVGFFIFGPQMLIGVAAAELSHKKAAATSTGLVGFVAYVGAAIAGYPLGIITQNYGWYGFFVTLIGCSGLSALILMTTWSLTDSRSASKQEQLEPETEETEAEYA